MDNDSNIPVTPEETAEGRAPVQSAFAKPSRKRPSNLAVALIAVFLTALAVIGALAYL